MPKRGKKYIEAASKVDRIRAYTPEEAIKLVREANPVRFDATVETHLRLGVDPRHADQQVRGVVLLPHGTGKEVRILVFAEGEEARAALEAGADYAGSDELIEKIQGGWTDFDIAIATPPMMGKVGRLGRILGPRGLMPSPKTGTIVPGEDIPRVVSEARLGRVEFRVDKTSNVHVPIGKASFSDEQLMGNFVALMEAIVRARPAASKGQYVRKAYLTTTMGPSIKVDPQAASNLRAA